MKRVYVLMLLLVTSVVGAFKGKDGNYTVSGNQVVNYFTGLTAVNNVGGVTLTVSNITDLNDGSGIYASAALSAGDMIMLYQAQGASFSNTSNTASYGEFTLNNAGRYEIYEVISVAGNDILVADNGTLCDATSLIYSYELSETQVIRVPQFENLTIGGGNSIITTAWNGSRGGVIAIDVNDTLTVNGQIDASASGFRGGATDNVTTGAGTDVTLYRGTLAANGAEKGESILGFQTDYDTNGRYGRGAPANGGGGGNAHNGGGGGGANGDNSVVWNGQGNPDNGPANWSTAWDIDGTLTSATTSSGGGRGGYTYGSQNRDAITVAPGTAGAGNWGGNLRRERGGLGGRPLPFNDVGRLFFGGGGGAGDGNNGRAGAGGNGGGLIYLITDNLAGSGIINANGQIGFDTADNGGNNDAPGGGGAGGTIVVSANTTSASVNLTANGGKGGDQLMIGNENEGPGGGGGGGVISVSGGTGIPVANGGVNGVSESTAVTEFIANGATIGAIGQPNEVTSPVGDLPICVAGANLSITKSDSNDPVNPNDPLTYTIRVDNAGPGLAQNVVVTESLPAGVTFVSTVGCTEDPNGVPTCSLGDIAANGFAEYTVAVTVDASTSGTITNNVSVTSDTPDPDTSDNTTDEETTVNPLANLSVTKVDSVDPVNPGAPLTYTIRVDNAGPSTAVNVVSTDALPAGVTFVSTTGCNNDPNGVPICNLGNINANAFAEYTVSVNVNNNATGSITNNVSVTSDITDPDTSDNNTDETTSINPFADLSIIKTDSVDPVNPGDALTYTITVNNAGPATASNVVVTDTLPAGVTLVSTTGCAEDPNGVPTCSLANIASGASAQYTVSVNVNNNATGTLTNNVSVTSDTTDPDTSDNNTDEDTTVNAEANLSITKIDSADPVDPGDALTYTIQVNNAGPATASNVVVTDTLPAGVTLVSTTGCAEDPNGVPTCSLGNIASGGSAQYTVAVTVNNNVTGTLTNNVSVTSDTTDPDLSDNTDDEMTDVNDTANLSITKTDSADPVNPGDALTYTITVNNAGPATATNVVATEALPAGVTFVSTAGCAEDPAGVPTCSLGNIASGASVQYTVAVTVDNNATGTLTNNVSVTSDTPDPDTNDNNTDETTDVDEEADLSISKTDSADPVTPGDALTYTVRVDNAGPSTATNVVVTESLPAGVTFVSTNGCTADPNGVPTCSLGDIASGAFVEYTVAVTVDNNASGTLTNNVSVTSDTTDPDTSNNDTDENTDVNDVANLSITKTDSADPVTPGDPLTYTITVNNAGPATATNVVATEVLPAGVTFVSTAGCAEDPAGVPTCNLGDIVSGGSAQYTVAVTINNNASGTLTNNVSVTSDLPDPDTSDNDTDEETIVGDAANLSIIKTDSSDPVNPGDALTYTITVNNAGPATATNVVATEVLPAGVTFVSTAGCAQDPAGVPTCNLGDIVSGGSAQYTVAVTVDNNAAGTLTNNVSVTSDLPDPDTNDNDTDEETSVVTEADLSITKTDSADPITPGDALTYTIRVDNAGPSTATNVVATEILPAGVTFVSTTGCAGDPNGVPTCNLSDIASGAFAEYTVAVTVDLNASGTLTNNVSVTADTTDPDTSNNDTNENTDVIDVANLSITKTDSADPVSPGDALTYTIRVDNAGPATATNVVATDVLPAGVTFVSTAGCIQDPTGVPTCGLGDIASGGFAEYTVSVTVDNNTNGTITNNVSVTSDLPDPDTSDNDTDEETIVGDAANLSITKTDSVDPVNPGDALTYTIRVDNAGPSTATNVVATESLPADVSFVSTAGCTQDPNGVPTCNLGDIASGGFAEYTVSVMVNDNASGTLTNNVSVTSDLPDPDTNDNDTDEETSVSAPSLEIVKEFTSNDDEDGSGTVTLNDTLNFTITATNDGDATLNNVVVSDPMITPDSITCVTLAVGAQCQLVGTYVVQQSDVDNGEINNTGTADSDETDPETDVVVVVVGNDPDLSIDKSLTDNADEDSNNYVSLGDTVTFTIVATNTGNVTLNNVLVEDDMITPGDITCLTVDVGNTCVLVGTYVIQQSDVDNGELTNIATAGSDETGQRSDTTDLTINVGAPPPPAMVPSTTFWGQLLLLILITFLGMHFVRKDN